MLEVLKVLVVLALLDLLWSRQENRTQFQIGDLMKKILFIIFTITIIGLFSAHEVMSHANPKPFSTTIYQGTIHGIKNKEIIVSLVELPPKKAAPLHKHPGEEYAFIISGEAIQNIDYKGEETIHAGEVAHIPYGAVHSVRAGKKPFKALVFRIHDKGKPERCLVEAKK